MNSQSWTVSLFLLIAGINLGKTAHENAQEIRNMCELYSLLTLPITAPTTRSADGGAEQSPQAKAADLLSEAIKLNLTAVQGAMAEALTKAANANDEKKLVEGESGAADNFKAIDSRHHKSMMQQWDKITGKAPDESFKKLYNLPLTADRKHALAPMMKRLATEALNKHAKANAQLTAMQATMRKARHHMAAAIYGPSLAQTPALAEATIDTQAKWIERATATTFPWNTGNRDTACAPDGTATDKASAALAIDMVCICGKQDATGEEFCSVAGQQISSAKTGGITSQAAAFELWQEISSKCQGLSENTPPGPTATRLRTAAAAILNLLGKNKKGKTGGSAANQNGLPETLANVLGMVVIDATTPPGCATNQAALSSNTGVGPCIDYSAAVKSKTGIRWLKEVDKAADALEQLAEEKPGLERTLAEADAITEQMKTLLLMADALATSQEAINNSKNKNSKMLTKDSDDCDTIKKATDCEQKGPLCEWKNKDAKEGPHCKLNETNVEKQATQAGGTTTAGPNCASHNDKTKCEEENKGKSSPVCGWRKGKDNEDDKDTEKCRNASFLLNKQFALSMVSAAFVALLF
uniref:Variant surface glycoprotein n=1 Tax=Trypanosoma brucei TaxID=5691 RepID=A0A1V0G0B0_9TRYP|nr:variant surface glycoprotein [Trypanosoma brucei]